MTKKRYEITRYFVQVGSRAVHYRHAGYGQPVILIHQSPKSSAELEAFISALAPHFSVYAPDTPGYGLSDPLADTNANIDDFVDALVALFDALTLTSPVIYGSHSGAIFGVRLAMRYPHRVGGLIANGILINDRATREDLVSHYFPQFEPQWSGEHLTRVWSRIRDQHCFYPWYRRQADSRIHWPATIEEMHDSAIEILAAAEHYQTGYRAVLEYDIQPDIAALAVPALLIVAKSDVLVNYVPLYPPLPDNVTVSVPDDYVAIPIESIEFIYNHCSCEQTMPVSQGQLPHPTKRFIEISGELLYCQFFGEPTAPPLLLVHDLFQSSRQCQPLIDKLSETHWVIAVDLPGHGYSVSNAISTNEVATVLLALLQQLQTLHIDVVFVGRSGLFAEAVAQVKPADMIIDVLFVPNSAGVEDGKLYFTYDKEKLLTKAPDLSAQSSGSHFLTAWYYLKDSYLFTPWYCREYEAMISDYETVSVKHLQLALLNLLVSWRQGNRQLEAAISHE